MSLEVPSLARPEDVQGKLFPFIARLGIPFDIGDTPSQACDKILQALDAEWHKTPKAGTRLAIDYAYKGSQQPRVVLQKASEFNKYKPQTDDTEFLLMSNSDGYRCVYCWLENSDSGRRTVLFFDPAKKYTDAEYVNEYKTDMTVTNICNGFLDE